MTSAQAEAVVVLGPHRSGTSCLTEVVHAAGYDVGKDVLGAHDCNVKGLWENAAVVALNERLLFEWGSAWFDPALRSIETLVRSDGVLRAIEHVIKEQFPEVLRGATRIVIKDPRLCVFAPLYARALATLGMRTRYVIALRHPRECAQSLYRRDGLPIAVGLALWITHMLGAVRAAGKADTLFMDYDELTSQPLEGCSSLLQWLCGPEVRPDPHIAACMRDRVVPDLKHQRGGERSDSSPSSPIEALAEELFASLRSDREDLPSERLVNFERRYRELCKTGVWLEYPAMVCVHDQFRPELLNRFGDDVGSLVIIDGEEASCGYKDMAPDFSVGVFYNRCQRGEAASLLRAASLCPSKPRILLSRRALPDVASLGVRFDELRAGSEIVVFKAGLQEWAAIFIPAACEVDFWRYIPEGDGAVSAMLVEQVHRTERV